MLYGDCRSAIVLAKNNIFHRRTKHRSKIESGDNTADMLTKPVQRKISIQLTRLLRITEGREKLEIEDSLQEET